MSDVGEPDPDMIDLLGGLLSNEEGLNVVEAIDDLKVQIVHQLTVQNKILVKMLSAMTKVEPPEST
jgi:hypothetical protein